MKNKCLANSLFFNTKITTIKSFRSKNVIKQLNHCHERNKTLYKIVYKNKKSKKRKSIERSKNKKLSDYKNKIISHQKIGTDSTQTVV
jgi:hypothetical protein